MKTRILQLLKQSEGYLSGETLSRQLGVTRSAVWKAVKSLQQAGYPIEAVTNRGYRLLGEADVLSGAEIEEQLRQKGLQPSIGQVVFQARTGSTNQLAKEAAEQGAPDISLFVAECQTAGRGRRGRTWISDHRQGLWFSLLLRPQADPEKLSRITLFAGLCVARALRGIGAGAAIKWPNDIVSAQTGRKLGGILTEMVIEENRVKSVVIGIGLNVNTAEFPTELAATASSLFLEGGGRFRRTEVLAAVLEDFVGHYAGFLQTETWLDDYRSLCLTLGREIQAIKADGTAITGRAVDLDPAGELVIEDQDGCRQVVRSGEVSVRGLLGYN